MLVLALFLLLNFLPLLSSHFRTIIPVFSLRPLLFGFFRILCAEVNTEGPVAKEKRKLASNISSASASLAASALTLLYSKGVNVVPPPLGKSISSAGAADFAGSPLSNLIFLGFFVTSEPSRSRFLPGIIMWSGRRGNFAMREAFNMSAHKIITCREERKSK